MRRQKFFKKEDLRPFASVLLIIGALFLAALSKITLRRLSYALYHESKNLSAARDEYYFQLKEYGRVTRSERLERLAKTQAFGRKKKGQVIQVIDGKAIVID